MLACQSCQTSLLLYSSITSIDEFLTELEQTLDTNYLDPSYRIKLAEDISNDTYKFLDESTSSNASTAPLVTSSNGDPDLEIKLDKLGNLLSMLMDLTTLDHPICAKCCYELSSRLAQYCEALRKEKSAVEQYKQQLDEMHSAVSSIVYSQFQYQRHQDEQHITTSPSKNRIVATPPTTHLGKGSSAVINESESSRIPIHNLMLHSRQRLIDIYHEEQQLSQEIASLDAALAQLDVQEQQLFTEEQHLQELQSNYFRTFVDLQFSTSQYTLAASDLQNQLDFVHQTTELLNVTNPYFDLFQIDLISPVPSISGFRLGRIESIPVEYSEINMALGQVCLLIEVLRKKLRYTFSHYSIFVNSHESKIFRPLNQQTSSAASTSSSSSSTQQFGQTVVELLHFESTRSKFGSNYDKLNRGLECLLDCIAELYTVAVKKAEARSIVMPPPPKIQGHTINGHSVRFSKREESKWNFAMKEVLQALHFIVCLVVITGNE